MSKKLKIDLALFAAAFLACAVVLGADTSVADIVDIIVSAMALPTLA